MTKQQYLRHWLTKAEHDLIIIRQGMDRPDLEWVSEVKQYAELAERILNDLRSRIGL